MRTLSLLAVLPLALSLAPLRTAPTTAVDETVLLDQWDLVEISDAPSGYGHTVVSRSGDGDDALFTTTATQKMRMNRMGTSIAIEVEMTTVEDAQGRMVSIDSLQKMSTQETRVRTEFEGGVARTTTTTMGEARTVEKPVPDDARGAYWIGERTKEMLDTPGATATFKTWTPEANDAIETTVHVIGKEPLFVGGEKLDVTKVEATVHMMGDITTTSWIDAEGDTVQTSITIAGMTILTKRSDEAAAVDAWLHPSEISPDVFARSMVVSDVLLPRSRHADRALLRLTAKRDGYSFPDLADARQQLLEAPDARTVVIETRRVVPEPGTTGVRPLVDAPEELRPALSASSMVQSDHPDLIAAAKEAVGDERDAWKAAQKIERWVYENVTDKNMGVGFASALEVCTNRSGDCSEHAVLLCGLARAAGIPSRVAMGLLYLGGIWGGHAWTEVWIDGHWYALDGTIGRGSVDALHLTLSTMMLADDSPAQEFAKLVQVLGEIDIDVEELGFGERTVPCDPSMVRVEDGRYTNAMWGFSVAIPEGFECELEKRRAAIGFEEMRLQGKAADGKRVRIELTLLDDAYADSVGERLLDQGAGTRTAVEVDGRPGTYVDVADKRRTARVLSIDTGGALYVLQFDRMDSAEQKALFDAVVASIDFDVSHN
ncbi:MAG: transglutaminase-like domain-containing protein [Planctomycetota bacterium]